MKLYINGVFHSMDDFCSVHTALLERDGIIAELGKTEELIPKYPGVEIIDLGGKVVIPGIIDTHTHVFMSAYSEVNGELLIPESVSELLSDLRERVKSAGKDEWIVYKNTYPLRLSELRYPSLEELDAAAPDTPVVVNGFYSAQLNSKALQKLNLCELPSGAEALRNEKGELTGILTCANAFISKFCPDREGDKRAAVMNLMKKYNECGITTALEGLLVDINDIELVNGLYREGGQTVRMRYAVISNKELVKKAIATEMPDKGFSRVAFMKDLLEGGFLTGTAFMEYPYKNLGSVFSIGELGDDFCGIFLFNKDELCEKIKFARECGLQYSAHCVGSAGARRLLDAYKSVSEKSPILGERHALVHGDFVNSRDAELANELGVSLLFQPAWHYMDAPSIDTVLDTRDAKEFMNYADISKFTLAAAGSDHMAKHDSFKSVNPYNPFVGLYNMVTNRARDGKRYGEYTFTREDALAYYTRHAARAFFEEDSLGTLEVGKCADFAVLDRDYFTCPADDILKIKSVMTVVGGRQVL